MVDSLIELPFRGRTFLRKQGTGPASAQTATLPTFVAGPENRLVAATISRLIEQNRETRRAPRTSMFILHGASGTGKTHLARGLVNHWQTLRGAESAKYTTAIDIRRDLALALESAEVNEYRERTRAVELLAIDDIQQFPCQGHLHEELRYTLDALEERGSIVVVTASRPPSTLANLSPDIRSRLEAGLLLQLSTPGVAARKRIIRLATDALGRQISSAAITELASKGGGSVPEIFSALLELCAAPPSRASEASADQCSERGPRRPTLREIVAVVAKYYRVPQKVLKSSSRKQSAVYARAAAIFLARELADASYENIGKALGGRDHTTIIHGYRKMLHQRDRDAATNDSLNELQRILQCR